jgi:hypothetical protein
MWSPQSGNVTPTWPLKNGPWAWNTSLTKAKELPTQPMLSSSTYVVFSLLFQALSLLCSVYCVCQWLLGMLSAFRIWDSMQKEKGHSTAALKEWALHNANLPAWAILEPSSHEGSAYTIGLILHYVRKSIVPSSVCLCCVFCGDFAVKMRWAGEFGLLLLVISLWWSLLVSKNLGFSTVFGSWCMVFYSTWTEEFT